MSFFSGASYKFCQFTTDKMFSSLTELINQPSYFYVREGEIPQPTLIEETK